MKQFFLLLIFTLFFYDGFSQNPQDQVYYDVDYSLVTPTGEIKGTLCKPIHPPVTPLVIIIAGSGPTDRNGNSNLGINTDAYQMLAWDMAKKGISSIRFDKRGIGESKQAGASESALRFETYVEDVKSWVNHFAEKTNYNGIYILGHSEGSLIGMIASQTSPVKGFISIAGAGRPADQLLLEQVSGRLPDEMFSLFKADIDSLKNGMSLMYVLPPFLPFFRPGVQEYMKSWMKYDPAKEIKKVTVPVMLIQGTTDLQVKETDVRILAEARPESRLLILENMNHILKEAGADTKTNLETYKDPLLPLKDGLTDQIVLFIRTHQK